MYLLVPFFSVADTDVPVIEDVTRLAQQISLNTARAPSVIVPWESTVSETVTVEPRSINLEEARKIDNFCASGCGCRLVKGGPCSLQFSKEHYTSTRANAAELSWNELNVAVMGQVFLYVHVPSCRHVYLCSNYMKRLCSCRTRLQPH